MIPYRRRVSRSPSRDGIYIEPRTWGLDDVHIRPPVAHMLPTSDLSSPNGADEEPTGKVEQHPGYAKRWQLWQASHPCLRCVHTLKIAQEPREAAVDAV
jgi:hypothetical protein